MNDGVPLQCDCCDHLHYYQDRVRDVDEQLKCPNCNGGAATRMGEVEGTFPSAVDQRESVKTMPPAYPFPEDNVIFSSARKGRNFTLGENSWFCAAKIDEERIDIAGEKEHWNGFRFTIHTPFRGSLGFFVNEYDAMAMIKCALSILAAGDRVGDPPGEHTFNLDYYNRLISDDYQIHDATEQN